MIFEDFLAHGAGELAVSDWIDIDQARVNAFGDATHHMHWLHTAPPRAAKDEERDAVPE